MKRTLTSVIVAAVLMTWGAGGAWAAPELSFVGSTPPDGGTVMGSSVEIEVSITESALAGVTFNWDGTDYVLYDNSLVMMFNFDNVLPGETSTYFVDLSTHDNDGAGLFFEGDEIVSGKSAEYGNAVDFDGIDDYIRIEDSPELNVITFTIEFWFNAHNPTGKTQSLVARGEDLGFDIAQWVVELDDPQNPDTVQLWIEEGDDTDWHYGLNTRPMPDTWYHYAVTRSSNGTVKVYLNGVKENEWTNQADPGIVPAPITIGARTNMSQADPQDYFDGIIDEVRTWDIALSEGQVAEHYMSNLRKYGPDSWTLYVDQSNLASGDYTYQVSATSASLETGTAGPRTVTMDAPPIEAVIIKGPYLQQVSSESIVIMWETDIAADSRVDFGGTYVEDATPVTIHEIELTGLLADTTYAYTVTSGTTTSPASTFATAPASPRSFRFVAYGDTRTQPAEHAAVIQAIINSDPEIVIHTGDLVTNGRYYDEWEPQFFDPAYGLMIDTPMLPILGNHEYNGTGPLWFLDFFSLGNNDEWFAFTYGGVRFIGLNTCVDFSAGSTQYNWLVGELGSSEYTSATWHVVYFHHPPYSATSSHGDDANVKQYLVPLFEQNGVDIVFNGHSHAYERYYNNGIYYIVTGGGGAPLAGLVTDNEEPIREYGESVYHHCTIDVDVPGQSLTVSALYNDGVQFDGVTLTKTAQASNPSPADGAEDVPLGTVLSWKAGIDAISHDVYFGTADPPTFIQNQLETTYEPGPLEYETTYYWRIDESDGQGTTPGQVWSFTTEPFVPELPWGDGFESGEFATGGWATSGNASVSSKAVYSGVYGAEIKGTSWIEKAVSTVGFANINVKYARSTKGLDSGEYLYVEWYDGSSWNLLEQTQSTSWSLQDRVCDAAANDNADFKLRFATNCSNSAEYAYVDDVEIAGTSSEPVHDVAVTAIIAPASVVAGDTVTIDVTVANQGTFGETFDVTLADTPPPGGTAGAVTDSPQAVTLGPGGSTTVSFTWDTTGATLGDHTLDATAAPVAGETDTADNSMSTVVPVGSAITDIATVAVNAPSLVAQGTVANVDVTVENVGNQNVTADISVTLTDETDSAVIGTETIVGGLAAGASAVLTYSWDTSSSTIGDHALVAGHDFADDNNSNDSMSTTSTVTEAGATIHIESIEMRLDPAGKNWKAIATVGVGPAQTGATVVGNWHLGTDGSTADQLIQGGATGITDGTGTAVVVSVPKKAKTGEVFTFVVTDVVLSGYTYVPGDNVETSDSIPVP